MSCIYASGFTNKKDVYWSAIIDVDNGLFSKAYVDAFSPDISDNTKEFFVMSKEVYRECSEFAHGNFSVNEYTFNLEFREKTFLLWHGKSRGFERSVPVVEYDYEIKEID